MITLIDEVQDILGDRYTVEREIGRGGMATVLLAREHRPPRQVAIKVLRQELAQGMGRERFIREVEFSSQLTHPNIIPIFTADEVGDLLYYTMRCTMRTGRAWCIATSSRRTSYCHTGTHW